MRELSLPRDAARENGLLTSATKPGYFTFLSEGIKRVCLGYPASVLPTRGKVFLGAINEKKVAENK